MKPIPSLTAAFATALLLLAGGAAAQPSAADYPNKPVTLITPFAAGSGPDAVLRLVSDKLARLWNQRVVVDNQPGGGGFIAIDLARRAAPDGYTLLQLDSEHVAALPHLYKSKNFQTLQHFDPVAALFRTPFFVAVPTDSKWKNMSDLIAAAKAGPVSYGSWGVGSPGHLGAQQLEALDGHPDAARALPRGLAAVRPRGIGRVAVGLREHSVEPGHLQGRQAALHRDRGAPSALPQMPEVPTMAEAGGPASLEVNSFVSLLTPKGVPAAVRAKINADVAKVIADPEIRARFDTFAFEPLAWSPRRSRARPRSSPRSTATWCKRGNISLE